MNRSLALLTGILLSCIFSFSAVAQSGYEVKGNVVDQYGPVVAATVLEQGTANGTSTDVDGDFSLTVSGPDAVVEISCKHGYKMNCGEIEHITGTFV